MSDSPDLAIRLAEIAQTLRQFNTTAALETAADIDRGAIAIGEADRLLVSAFGYLPYSSRMRRARVRRFLERIGSKSSIVTAE